MNFDEPIRNADLHVYFKGINNASLVGGVIMWYTVKYLQTNTLKYVNI